MPGDLYVVIQVESHPIFVRDNLDIICDVPISFVQAALGAEIDVPTLDGKVKMKIPSGTQSGKVFRMKGKGIKDVQGLQQGDQHVRVTVETPTRLTAKQKELLKDFAALGGEEVNPLSKGFFDKVKELFGLRSFLLNASTDSHPNPVGVSCRIALPKEIASTVIF